MNIKPNNIYNGDCLEIMQDIPDKTIDMILCDLPYQITGCKWDTIVPFDLLWSQYERIIKDHGAIVLTASQPFTSKLIMSNLELFKYEWIWQKEQGVNFQCCHHQPLKIHESVLVFGKASVNYCPQGLVEVNKIKSNSKKSGRIGHLTGCAEKRNTYTQHWSNYPKSILKFQREYGLHPTQKPVPLFEYLINTYTVEDQTILDNCCGSGTTAIAAIRTNRNYICIEKDPEYFETAKERIKEELN